MPSSKRCSICGINWSIYLNVCRKCDGALDLVKGKKPHTEDEIEAMLKAPVERRDKVTDWRFEQLLSHGLDLDRAQTAASLPPHEFDIEEFRSLRLSGCTADTAYEILR
jgi:hypothetical protein